MIVGRYILRLTAIGTVFFVAAWLTAPSNDTAIHVQASILRWGGTLLGVSNAFLFQVIGKIEKLEDSKLDQLQLDLLRRQLQIQKKKAICKWIIALSATFLVCTFSFILPEFQNRWLLSASYGLFSVLTFSILALAYEYFTASQLQSSLTKDYERRQRERKFRKDVHGI